MSRNVSMEVFKFDELSTKAKQRALDDYRANFPRPDWHDYIYDEFVTIAGFLGFTTTVKQIGHSGFANQGDGACFEGEWNASDIDVDGLKLYAPQDLKLYGISAAMLYVRDKMPKGNATLDHYGRYYHEHSIRFMIIKDKDAEDFEGVDDTTEKEFKNVTMALFRWMYERLEMEYESITSDDHIKEIFKENEYEFFSDGDLYG